MKPYTIHRAIFAESIEAMILKIKTYKYNIDHNEPTACKFVYIAFQHNGEYPVYSHTKSYIGTLSASEIKDLYSPAEEGWKGTF